MATGHSNDRIVVHEKQKSIPPNPNPKISSMELAQMFRFNRTFAPTTPDLQPPHHQERLISIMASIQFDSLTGNLRFRDLNSSLRIGSLFRKKISLMQESFHTNLYLLDLHLQAPLLIPSNWPRNIERKSFSDANAPGNAAIHTCQVMT